jgi:hypothetical protein
MAMITVNDYKVKSKEMAYMLTEVARNLFRGDHFLLRGLRASSALCAVFATGFAVFGASKIHAGTMADAPVADRAIVVNHTPNQPRRSPSEQNQLYSLGVVTSKARAEAHPTGQLNFPLGQPSGHEAVTLAQPTYGLQDASSPTVLAAAASEHIVSPVPRRHVISDIVATAPFGLDVAADDAPSADLATSGPVIGYVEVQAVRMMCRLLWVHSNLRGVVRMNTPAELHWLS